MAAERDLPIERDALVGRDDTDNGPSRRLPHALILAAGASSRFGSPKALAEFRGETLLARAVRLAQACVGDHFTVVLGRDSEKIRRAIPLPIAHCVATPESSEVALATSLRIGLSSLPTDASATMVLLVDQPGIERSDLARLVDVWRHRPNHAVAARYGETLGAPCILPRRLFRAAMSLTGDHGARHLLRSESSLSTVDIPLASMDIDTPSDLSNAETTLPGGRLGGY